MSVPVRAGLLLGVLVVCWTFVMGFTGWYKQPQLVGLFFLVVPLEIGVVAWALAQTRVHASYGQQVMNGLVLSLVASVIIFTGSLLFTAVAFPTYFADIQAVQVQQLRAQGVGEAQIANQLAVDAAMQTPLMNALTGVIGTVVTGVLVAAIAAAFLRKKPVARV
jgi:hypothetical protein